MASNKLAALHGYSGQADAAIDAAMSTALSHRGAAQTLDPACLYAGSLSQKSAAADHPDLPTFLKFLRGSFVLRMDTDKAIHLARDAAGRRSLYYAIHNGRLLYASEPKAILAVPGFQRQLRPAAVAQFLTFSFIPGKSTMLESLHALPPGSFVTFDKKSKTLTEPQRYHFPEDGSPPLGQTDWIDEFNQTFDTAIDRLVPTDDPYAVFLSGGIDSSIVTARLAERSSRPIDTFAIHFGKNYPNELEYAAAVAAHSKTNHREIAIEPRDFIPRLHDFIRALDEPIGDPVALPNFELARIVAQEFGHVFNGEGGDPLFGGPKNVPMMLHHWYGSSETQAPGHRERAYLASYRRAYEELNHLLTPEFQAKIEPTRDLESILTPYFEAPTPRLLINKLSLINMRLKGAHLILPKVERTLGAHGITPLSPLFDEDLIDLSFRIPPTLKLERGIEKIIMKQAFAKRVPQSVIDRPKVGMRVPVYHWMQKELKRYAKSILSPKRLRADGIFNEERVKQLLSYRTEEGPGRYGIRLWMLITFHIWKDTVLDKN